MSEQLVSQQKDVWSDPRKLGYLHKVITDYVMLERKIGMTTPSRRVYFWPNEGRSKSALISVTEAQNGANNRLDSVLNRLEDSYLYYGVDRLAHNWSAVGDYLLTPKEERQPIDGRGLHWKNIYGICGGLCLAARFSEQEIAAEFNTVTLTATPETLPKDLELGYWDSMAK